MAGLVGPADKMLGYDSCTQYIPDGLPTVLRAMLKLAPGALPSASGILALAIWSSLQSRPGIQHTRTCRHILERLVSRKLPASCVSPAGKAGKPKITNQPRSSP